MNDFNGLPIKILDLKCANYLWDLININGEQVLSDFDYITQQTKSKTLLNRSALQCILLKENILLEKCCNKTGVVLDAKWTNNYR